MRPGVMATALAVILAGCSEGALDPDGGGLVPDGGGLVPDGGGLDPDGGGLVPDGGGLDPDGGGLNRDAGKCVGDLAIVGAECAPMFDGTEANLPQCGVVSSMGGQQTVWRCQDLIALMDSFGLGGHICYYDATSHALVGAEQGSDIGVYCGQTSLTIEAGRTDSMCRENAPTLQRTCERLDGGPPDADGGGLVPDGGGMTPDAGRCLGDFATIGAWCPPMFDGSEANLPVCRGLSPSSEQQLVRHCQDLIMLTDSYGIGADACYYDATSHELVGAEHFNDIFSYCGQTSASIAAGRTDPMCSRAAPTLQRPCVRPDGGGGQ